MKTFTIEISDNIYNTFRKFLETLPENSFKIYDDDPDELTVEEEEDVYSINKKMENGDYSDFEDWDKIKDEL